MKTIMNSTQIIKSEEYSVPKEVNGNEIKENDINKEYCSKICYDNPTFIGNKDNMNNQNQNNIVSNDIPIVSSNINNKDEKAITVEKYAKERTFSMSSIKSFKNMYNDRRYSRRLSIKQRKVDNIAPEEDENPLRRRMSFIKDTSGEEPIGRAALHIFIASLFAGNYD